jgi:alkyl sulfatase BDS1-like metallo-beta-lactamase superfamily hydrolase
MNTPRLQKSVNAMKSALFLLAVIGMTVALGLAQQNQPLVGESTTKISDHVWAIMGFPNIAIVAGERATLVVDTGMGPKNGATAARVAAKLAPNTRSS